jgi:predicted nucleic acid binding AN1-type Zn finger protein
MNKMGETDDIKYNNNKSSRCSCDGCSKKVGIIPFVCRCEKQFCIKHRMPETHNCLYDYKTNGKQKLTEENKCIEFQKILKI